MFSKILVANRGEIAVRVLRTCEDLEITGVAVHSDADAGALHVRAADLAVDLGGTVAGENYLDQTRIVKAALDVGAQAVHPGYGFLAENAEFARAVVDAGLVFIGPPAEAIEAMGEKVAARGLAGEADVPLVPGTTEAVTGAEQVLTFGEEHGYPLAIKASYGGGGRGMRAVAGPAEVEQALESARREAGAAFGNADVYVERYLDHARHVEVQIFADTHGNTVWLGDRDCSVQRRHQKLVEESPAPGLSDELRRRMGEAAIRLARRVGYVGAGTVEFLVEDEKFYFLEMNTRIQVEHPVTEQVLGLDLVAEQIRVAAGERLSVAESGPTPRGHAIECRINAENTAGGLFVPSPGRITRLSVPVRTGVRLDLGYESGDEVPPYYDSMIGKLVVWAPDRDTAIRRTLAALDALTIEGVPTTIPACQTVLAHKDFGGLGFDTRWLETTVRWPAETTTDNDPTDVAEGEPEQARDEVWVAGRRYSIPFFGDGAAAPAGAAASAAPAAAPSRRQRSSSAGSRGGGRRAVADGGVTSPMQGTVIKVAVTDGQSVEVGDVLFVVEAMKMENPVRASVAGQAVEITVAVGDTVAAGARLARIETAT